MTGNSSILLSFDENQKPGQLWNSLKGEYIEKDCQLGELPFNN